MAKTHIQLFAAAFLLVMLSVLGQAAEPGGNEEFVIVVTDRGINQKSKWSEETSLGVTKTLDGLNWIYGELPRIARVPVVMPDQTDFRLTTTRVLRQQILDKIKSRVSAARAAGLNRIEIQLVEDIDTFSYINVDKQKDVDRFGAAAYGAITDVIRDLSAKGIKVRSDAVLGSSATKVWAANVENWQIDGKSIWASVDLFDGRAELLPAVRAIKAAGPSNVRIFNTRGDYWADDLKGYINQFVLGQGTGDYFVSIAKTQTAAAIKDLLPGVKTYYLLPDNLWEVHTSGITEKRTFTVRENLGTNGGLVTLQGKFTGRQLSRHEPLPEAPSRQSTRLPKPVDGGITIWRESAEDWAQLLGAYSAELDAKHGGKNRALPYVKLASDAGALYLAIRKELDRTPADRVIVLSNDIVESSLRFMLGALDVRERIIKKDGEGLRHAEFLDGLVDIGGFALRVASEGTVDAEAVKRLQGGTLKLGKEAVLNQARKSLEKLHDIEKLEREISAVKSQISNLTRGAHAAASSGAKPGLAGAPQLQALQHQVSGMEREFVARRALVDKAHRNVSAVLLMLDALPEFAAAIKAQKAAGNRLTLEVVDRYSDAVIMLASSFLTSQLVQRVPVIGHFAGSARDAMVMASRHYRDSGMPKAGSLWYYSQWHTQKGLILDQYTAYLERQRLSGQQAMTMSQYFRGIDLSAAGFRAQQIAKMDAGVQTENARLTRANASPRAQEGPRETAPAKVTQPEHLPEPRVSSVPPWCILFPNSGSCRGPLAPPPRRPPPPPSASTNPPNSPSPHQSGGGASCPKPPCDDVRRTASSQPNSEGEGGGAVLRAIAELHGDALPEIRGVVYDKASQRLVLVGERAVKVPILHESDLAMALWLTFGPRQADPQFSLDPADPRNPRGKWLKAVYLPREMAGTPFGENLFEADWLMKQLSFAVKVTADGKMEARKLAIPNFKSVRDLIMDAGHLPQDQHQWARLWLYSDKMIVELKDDTLSFVTATIGVRSCQQVVDPTSPTGLRDADCDKVTVESQWAKQFTARYGEVAKELPEFARLTELAKAVAIAKWLKKEGIAVDLDWAVNQVNKRTIKGTAQVTALSVNWTSQQRLPFNDSRGQGIQTITRTLNLFGGVDLTVKPQYVPDKGAAKALQQAVFKGLSDHPGESVFELQVGGKAYYAKVLPLNPRFHSVQLGRTESGKAGDRLVEDVIRR